MGKKASLPAKETNKVEKANLQNQRKHLCNKSDILISKIYNELM